MTAEAIASPFTRTPVPPHAWPSNGTASAMLRWAASFAATADLSELLPVTAQRSWIPVSNPAGWDAWLIAWPAGSDTGWHDHQGAAGGFYVARGVLTEFSLAGGRSAAAAGNVGEIVSTAAPIASWTDVRTRRVDAGRGRGLGTNHVHHVVNEYDQPAYSVHAYSPRLYGMTRYTWRDDLLVLAGSEADTAP
jgi:Cysteine dioxygenase type I